MNDTKAGWLQHPAAASLWVFGRWLRAGERLGHHRGPGDGSAERAHRYGRRGTGVEGWAATWNQSSPKKKTDTSFASPSSTKWTFFSPQKTVESAAIPSPGRRGQPLSARSLTAASRDLRAAVLLPPDTEREALHAVHAVGSSVIFMVILWWFLWESMGFNGDWVGFCGMFWWFRGIQQEWGW